MLLTGATRQISGPIEFDVDHSCRPDGKVSSASRNPM
jgi:hypothetical protein